MTRNEFDRLKRGDVVEHPSNGTLYEIKDDDAWGPPNKVCYAEILNSGKFGAIQISESNYAFWKVKNAASVQ